MGASSETVLKNDDDTLPTAIAYVSYDEPCQSSHTRRRLSNVTYICLGFLFGTMMLYGAGSYYGTIRLFPGGEDLEDRLPSVTEGVHDDHAIRKEEPIICGKVVPSSCNTVWEDNYFGIELSTYNENRQLFTTGNPIVAGRTSYYIDAIQHHTNCNYDVGLVYIANKKECADGTPWTHTDECGFGGKLTAPLTTGDDWCLHSENWLEESKTDVDDDDDDDIYYSVNEGDKVALKGDRSSDERGANWEEQSAEEGKEVANSEEEKKKIEGLFDKGEWVMAYGKGSFEASEQDPTLWSVGSEYVKQNGEWDDYTFYIRRVCWDCAPSHQDVIYKRLTKVPATMDIQNRFLSNWYDKDNVLGVDFNLYNNIEDAQNDRNEWNFCNYNDPGVGFPRDCGPESAHGGQWNSLTRGGKRDVAYYLWSENSSIGNLLGEIRCGVAENPGEIAGVLYIPHADCEATVTKLNAAFDFDGAGTWDKPIVGFDKLTCWGPNDGKHGPDRTSFVTVISNAIGAAPYPTLTERTDLACGKLALSLSDQMGITVTCHDWWGPSNIFAVDYENGAEACPTAAAKLTQIARTGLLSTVDESEAEYTAQDPTYAYQTINALSVKFSVEGQSYVEDGDCCLTPPWRDPFTELCEMCLFKVAFHGAPDTLKCRFYRMNGNYEEVELNSIHVSDQDVTARCPTSFWDETRTKIKNGVNTYRTRCTRSKCPELNIAPP